MAMTPSKGRTLSTRRAIPKEILDLLRSSDGTSSLPLAQRGQVAALKGSSAAQALLDQTNSGRVTILRSIKVDGREFLVFQLPLS